MHPVLEHILARKDKTVPVHDGRKVVLALFGGTMAGVRGGGAVTALQELGLSHVFDEIHVISCGFPNAAYMLADDTARGTSIYYEDLSGRKFINFFRLWKIVDIDYLMDVFKSIKRLNIEKVLSSKSKVFVGVRNVENGRQEYFEIHDFTPSELFDLIETSISVPYFHPGCVTIRGGKFMDVGFTGENAKKHLQRVLNSDASDILVTYNRIEHKKIEFPPQERICEVVPDQSWKLGRLETRKELLKIAAQQMGDLVKRTFGDNTPVDLNYASRS